MKDLPWAARWVLVAELRRERREGFSRSLRPPAFVTRPLADAGLIAYHVTAWVLTDSGRQVAELLDAAGAVS